jgi:DNA-binding transcriptional regulator YiaG
MPNIASVLKAEISRVARKEIRNEAAALKKAVATYRSDIAELKRRAKELEATLRVLSKATAKKPSAIALNDSAQNVRFSAKGLASHRKRLNLSAADCGLLLGASDQSVYKWEDGKVRPRAKHLPAIAALRTLTKTAAAHLVETLRKAA